MDDMLDPNRDASRQTPSGESCESGSAASPCPAEPSSACGCNEARQGGASLPPPPPPPVDASACGCDSCSGWRPFLWGVLAVLAVLLVWSIWTASPDSAMARLIPAEAVLYLEAGEVEAIGTALAAAPLWKEQEGGAGVRELQDKGYEHIAAALGSVRERVVRDLVRHVDAFAVGSVPGDTGALTWIAVLRAGNESALLEVLRKEVASNRDTARIAGVDVERLTLFHGGSLYVILRDGHVVLTPSERQVEFLLAKRGTRASVADLGILRRETVPALHILTSVQPLVKEIYGKGLLDQIPAFLPAMEPRIHLSDRVNPNARLAVSLRFPRGRAELQTTMIAPDEVRPRGRGVLSYILCTALVLIVIVVAIPVVFLISVLLLAAYFYIMAWWRGELSPSSPPAPKPLSPQAREDLGLKDNPPAATGNGGAGPGTSSATDCPAESVSCEPAADDASNASDASDANADPSGSEPPKETP